MTKWIDKELLERRVILQQTAAQEHLPEYAVEKDWWVSMTLKALFKTSCKEHLEFKGGTSLSKGWHLIDRFSEDIDVALNHRFFVPQLDNNTQLKNLRKKSRKFIVTALAEDLDAQMIALGLSGYEVKPEIVDEVGNPISSDADPTVIYVNYPSVSSDRSPYVSSRVKIEISCLSMDEPFEMRTISSIISAYFPEDDGETECAIPVVLPSRTFLEKAFLLNEEFQKPEPRSLRMTRHLYDLEKLMDTDFGKMALSDKELYGRIVEHRRKFYHVGYADYDKDYPETIEFIPPSRCFKQWEADYDEMLEHFVYGKHLSFSELIERISELQQRFRTNLKPNELEIRRIVEYSAFFVGEEPIDIRATLKHFSRNTLIRMTVILSLHYGNMCFPDNQNTLFSEESSKKHIPYLNKLFTAYYKRLRIQQGQKVEILTYRTSLELWRHIFAIPVEEFTNDIDESDIELVIFKVVLSINEQIVNFTHKEEHYKTEELIFLSGFLTNDGNNYDLKILQSQSYYFHQLINFIPSNAVLRKATDVLFENWGIDNWQQYYTTLLIVAYETDGYIQRKDKGVPIITRDWIDKNKKFLSLSLFEHLYIDEDDYIPYNDEDASKSELNRDYRRFRSKPLVKLKDGSGYVVINNQLVCERLFNSLYFDYSPLINGKKNSCGFFDYNKDFIEKVLFRNTFYNCLSSNCYTFPARGGDDAQEKPKEPDFYARTKRGELIIVECKAVKMNGECRDDGDYKRLLDELHEKIVLKTRNLDPMRKEQVHLEYIGVGQLINHIDSIEADTFEWDKNIPDDVIYYPLLVFEDVKLVQKGILSIVNRWFYEEVKKKEELSMLNMACRPIMVVSINTLYLQDNLLRERGLTNVIDLFVNKNAKRNPKTGEYFFSALADFDDYLMNNPYDKSSDMIKWHKQLMDGLEEDSFVL